MKRSKFTEPQIAFVLQQAKASVPIAEVCPGLPQIGWAKTSASHGVIKAPRVGVVQSQGRSGELREIGELPAGAKGHPVNFPRYHPNHACMTPG